VAFIPALHKTYREISVFFPSLSPEDVAQQVLTIFLEVIRFSSLERRNSHLPVAIARKVRNFAFRWAVKESQDSEDSEPADGPPPTPPEPVAPGDVETSYVLWQFLEHCRRIGALTSSELDLLVKLKFEGFEAKEIADMGREHSAMAVHQRLHRIIQRLRRTIDSADSRGADGNAKQSKGWASKRKFG
jgi:DNA-directed RNA polymerase specialized sigma24 family protein